MEAAVPQTSLTRLGLTAAMLPAEVRLEDRFDGSPLVVRVTGVYRAADPGDPYWSLDPLGGREIQVGGFTTYGPLLIDDSLFTTARLPQNGRSWLLGADFTGVRSSGGGAIRDRAEGLGADLKKATGLQVRTELPDVLRESDSSALVSRSTLLIGALQLTVLAAAVLLLVVHLMAARQESENALLAARGASGGRLGVFTAAESLLLALPAALLAPLLTPSCFTCSPATDRSPGYRWTPVCTGRSGPSRPSAPSPVSWSPRPPPCCAAPPVPRCAGPESARRWSPARSAPAPTSRWSASRASPTTNWPSTTEACPRTPPAGWASTRC